MAPEAQWRKLARLWERELEAEHLPYMHMAELESCRGLFRGWAKQRAQALQLRLLKIIKRHATWGVSCSILQADYERLVLKDMDPELPKKVGSPYGLCALGVISVAVESAKALNPTATLDFVFEQGMPPGELLSWFERQRRSTPSLGTLQFEDKKAVLPLQAADIHAYEAWKHSQNQIVPAEPRRDVRKSLQSLFGMPISGRYLDAEGLAGRIAEVRHATEY